MWSPLTRGTSEVDWCEENYLFTPLIAEFVNTISSVAFLIFPPLLSFLFKPYAQSFNPGIQIIWLLLFVIGLSSIYFHATLSLVGQLLDELAILWALMAGFGLWFPEYLLPAFLQYNRCKNRRVRQLGTRCSLVWILSIFCWISDRMFCDLWTAVRFPYLHGIWHVCIFIASYTVCVLFAYFDAHQRVAYRNPVMAYWPVDSWEWGIPYIVFKSELEPQVNKFF